MKSQDYWKKRFEILETARNTKSLEYYQELEKQYRKAADNVEKQLLKWYSRYATENGISMVEAKRLLNARELKEFQMSVEEYIEKGKSLNPKWAKQLEKASVRVHVSRLEALELQIQQQIELIYAYEVEFYNRLAVDTYKENYHHAAYEIQVGTNVGFPLNQLNTDRIEKVVSKPWAVDGGNFSSRIWTNKALLVNELHTQLTQMIILGESPEKAISAIAEKFNVSKKKARRLVLTESAFFASASQKDCFNDLGVERFEFVATLDLKTSELCRGMDGKVFPMSEYKIGTTAPPLHAHCRSTTAPYFENNYGERIARGKDGKTFYVPSDMKYAEWYDTYIK